MKRRTAGRRGSEAHERRGCKTACPRGTHGIPSLAIVCGALFLFVAGWMVYEQTCGRRDGRFIHNAVEYASNQVYWCVYQPGVGWIMAKPGEVRRAWGWR